MRTITLALLGLALLGATGCSSMARLNITVQIDPKHVQGGIVPTIEVNLVGINESEMPQWQTYAMDQYWAADDKLRKSADRYIMRFGETKKWSHVLKSNASVWDTWGEKTSKHLFILADIPGVTGKGGADPRRIILPLNPKAWSDTDITITIRPGGMTSTPAPNTTD